MILANLEFEKQKEWLTREQVRRSKTESRAAFQALDQLRGTEVAPRQPASAEVTPLNSAAASVRRRSSDGCLAVQRRVSNGRLEPSARSHRGVSKPVTEDPGSTRRR